MPEKANDLSHAKRMCESHIVFTPKYRRKVILKRYWKSLGEYFVDYVVIKGERL